MKKIILISLLLFVGFGLTAQNRVKDANKANNQLSAKKVLRRTAIVIRNAHGVVKQNNVYTGNLSKAVRHQKFARVMYRSGKFGKAIRHSRRARQLAFIAINANKGKVDPAWEFTKEEDHKGDAMSDADLEKELPMEDITDEDIINASEPDVDINDKE